MYAPGKSAFIDDNVVHDYILNYRVAVDREKAINCNFGAFEILVPRHTYQLSVIIENESIYL